MYEAVDGRMSRLEKTALLIWNKHAHLALAQKEFYHEWLAMYRHDWQTIVSDRRTSLVNEYTQFRWSFQETSRNFLRAVGPTVQLFVHFGFKINTSVSFEQSLLDLYSKSEEAKKSLDSGVKLLKDAVTDYKQNQLQLSKEFQIQQRERLIHEWQDNLYRLNNAINRRVGSLKDMETDLEETLRFTIIQHEIEASVFEQNTCAKLESFWVEQRAKMKVLTKKLKEAQSDYRLSRSRRPAATASRSFTNKAIDELLMGTNRPVDAVGLPQHEQDRPVKGGAGVGQQTMPGSGLETRSSFYMSESVAVDGTVGPAQPSLVSTVSLVVRSFTANLPQM